MLEKIFVKDSNIVLIVDPSVEAVRARTFEPLLLMHGSIKKAKPFDYAKYAPLDPMDRCFDNAMESVLRYQDLSYVEGVALMELDGGGLFQLPHGWCEDSFGNVVDPTSHKTQHHASIQYFGIPIRTDYHQAWKKRVGYYGCLDGDKWGAPIGVHYEDPSLWLASAINCNWVEP